MTKVGIIIIIIIIIIISLNETYSRHDIAEKLLIWRKATLIHSLTYLIMFKSQQIQHAQFCNQIANTSLVLVLSYLTKSCFTVFLFTTEISFFNDNVPTMPYV